MHDQPNAKWVTYYYKKTKSLTILAILYFSAVEKSEWNVEEA
jgi:hypothetical protein